MQTDVIDKWGNTYTQKSNTTFYVQSFQENQKLGNKKNTKYKTLFISIPHEFLESQALSNVVEEVAAHSTLLLKYPMKYKKKGWKVTCITSALLHIKSGFVIKKANYSHFTKNMNEIKEEIPES